MEPARGVVSQIMKEVYHSYYNQVVTRKVYACTKAGCPEQELQRNEAAHAFVLVDICQGMIDT